MSDTRTTDADQADEQARKDEWARLSEGEGGQPATDPDPLDDAAGADDPAGDGQDEAPPAGSDPGRASDEQPGKPDPWADAPPELRTAFEATAAELERTKNHLSAQNGRLSAETRNRLALEARLAEAAKDKPKEEEKESKPALDNEAVKTLRDEYPDVAGPLLDVIAALESKVTKLSERDASREEQATVAQQLEDQRFLAEQEQSLAESQPDWRTTCASTAFADWAKTQPTFIKEGLARNAKAIVDAAEAAKIVQMFKDETGVPANDTAAKRTRQIRGSQLPTTKVPSAQTTQATDRESEWARLEALEKRQSAR